ncbi:MAG: hydrogen peroxide-inducible genes activator OxyR [Myxococcales bacterium]
MFERLSRGVVVTGPGAAVLDRARRTLREADDVLETALRAQDPLAGTLRIGVIPTVAPYLLPEVARVLRARFPALTILWVEEKTRLLVDRMLQKWGQGERTADVVKESLGIGAGELDGGIAAAESELGDLERAPLGRDAFSLAVSPEHRLAKSKGPVRPSQLEGETVLLLDDGHCFRAQALALCLRSGAEEASMRATSLSTLAQMAAGGAGITLLPSIAIAAENRARGLVIRGFGARGPARTLVLAWRRTAPAGAALRAMAEAIRGVVTLLAEGRRRPPPSP